MNYGLRQLKSNEMNRELMPGFFAFEVCNKEGKLTITCSKHDDPTAEKQAASSWNTFTTQWMKEQGITTLSSEQKAALYQAYYEANSPVQMTQEYYDKYIKNVLYAGDRLSSMYWWNYPVTDGSGKLLYNVTFVNEYNTSAWWTGSATERSNIGKGYVVIVDGVTYVRTNTCVSPANSTNTNQTKESLISALENAGYATVQ